MQASAISETMLGTGDSQPRTATCRLTAHLLADHSYCEPKQTSVPNVLQIRPYGRHRPQGDRDTHDELVTWLKSSSSPSAESPLACVLSLTG